MFINAKKVDSAKFGNEAHFMSFAAIIATRNGTYQKHNGCHC